MRNKTDNYIPAGQPCPGRCCTGSWEGTGRRPPGGQCSAAPALSSSPPSGRSGTLAASQSCTAAGTPCDTLACSDRKLVKLGKMLVLMEQELFKLGQINNFLCGQNIGFKTKFEGEEGLQNPRIIKLTKWE